MSVVIDPSGVHFSGPDAEFYVNRERMTAHPWRTSEDAIKTVNKLWNDKSTAGFSLWRELQPVAGRASGQLGEVEKLEPILDSRETVHVLKITPEMRKHIKEKGQPYYSAGGAAVGAGALGATVASQQKDQRGD